MKISDLANPNVGSHVLAAVTASERLGLPEARIPLAVAVVEMCLSSKSNSAYTALDRSDRWNQKRKSGRYPKTFRDAHYSGAKEVRTCWIQIPT